MIEQQWSDEAVAQSFRDEIQQRFERHNADYHERDAAELEAVLKDRPDLRGQPGFTVRDSMAWEVYLRSTIQIDRNSVVIILPTGLAVGSDIIYMFDHTAMAWTRPTIGATSVDGEVHPTIEILLVATWTDDMDKDWRAAGHARKKVLVELYAEEIPTLCDFITLHAKEPPMHPLLETRDRLHFALDLAP